MGLMTIGPVMGTALIRAVGVDKRGPKGPLLLAESAIRDRIGAGTPYRIVENCNLISIDWVHLDSTPLREIRSRARISAPNSAEIEQTIERYLQEQRVPDEWRTSARGVLGVDPVHGT